jgi:hypothetical protein
MTYANGADGSCQHCGEATAQPWHLYCTRCFCGEEEYREPRGRAADRGAAELDTEEPRGTAPAVFAELDALEERLDTLEGGAT